jgi:hypothetical protein
MSSRPGSETSPNLAFTDYPKEEIPILSALTGPTKNKHYTNLACSSCTPISSVNCRVSLELTGMISRGIFNGTVQAT